MSLFNKTNNIDIKINDKLITDFLDTLRILLVSYLTTNESDIKKLKIDLMKPLLEQKWKLNDSIQAEKITTALNSKGEKIRRAWEQYKDDLLRLQRENKDTKLVEAKLEVLDKLMKGIDNV